MTVIEFGCMGVKPGMKIMDEDSEEGKVLRRAWDTVIAAPGGPKRVSWGLESLRDCSKVWAFFDWTSIEEHQEFAKVHGAEAVKEFPTVFTHGEFTSHVILSPPAMNVFDSPIAELLLAYFPTNVSISKKEEASHRLQKVLQYASQTCSEVQTVTHGWGIENDFPLRGVEAGSKGSLLVALIGWSDNGACKRFGETKAHRENLSHLQEVGDLLHFESFLIASRSVSRQAL